MKSHLSVRINSKSAGPRGVGCQHGAAAYALLSAAATDVDSKKHKKNPFHERYVQLCLTEFGQVQGDKAQQENCRTGAVVDDVAENLHVRMELIKNMKQSLMKQTSNAIKSFQSQSQRNKQVSRKQNSQTEQKRVLQETDTDHVSGAFFRPDVCANYLKLLQEEPVCHQDAQKLKERLLEHNPTTRPDSDLCFDMSKQVSAASSDTILSRLFPDGDEPAHVNLDALIPEGQHTLTSLHTHLTASSAADPQPQTSPSPEVLQALPNAVAYNRLLAVMKPYAEDQQKWDVWAEEEDSGMTTEEDAQIELPSYIRPASAAHPTPYPSILHPSHTPVSPDMAQLTAPAQSSQPAAHVDALAPPPLPEPILGSPPMHVSASGRQLHAHVSQLHRPPSQIDGKTAASSCARFQAPACAVCPAVMGGSCDEGGQPTVVATIIPSPATAVAMSAVVDCSHTDLGTFELPDDDIIEAQCDEAQCDEQMQGMVADFDAAASWPNHAQPAARAEPTMPVRADATSEVHSSGEGEVHSKSNAEAAEQQKPVSRFLPVLKRRTRALPSITLEEGDRPGIIYTGTEPGEEEQGRVEDDDEDIIQNHPAQLGSSQGHPAPKRAQGLVPTLRRHKALAGQPSASHMGQIPFRANLLRASNPSSPGQPNGFMARAEQVAVEPVSEGKEDVEEDIEHENDHERGHAESSVTRSKGAAAPDQHDPIEEDNDVDDRDQLPPRPRLNPHQGTKGPKQARRGAVSNPHPALVIMPDFSESNLARIQQGPLFRMPLGQKVCYRPVFDVETLLTLPPDPFNLRSPAQHKRHHKGGAPHASVVAPPTSPAGLDSIKIGAGMFSRSLLFNADLVQLKAQREAAQQSCQPDDDVVTGGFAEVDAMDEFGLADLDLDDDWDPVHGNHDSSSHHDRSAMKVDLSPQRYNLQMASSGHHTQASAIPGAASAAASEAALYGQACAVQMPDHVQTTSGQLPDDDTHLASATAAGFGQRNRAGDSDRCPLLFDIDSDPEEDRVHQLKQQATQPAVMLPEVYPQSSPDRCLLVMDPDSPSGNHVVAQHAQQPHHSWQQRTEPHVPSGPVSNLSPQTCELLMDLDSEPEEHEPTQLEQQHSHTNWQQSSKSELSLQLRTSATHSLMDTDSHLDPEDDQQQQQQHWQLQYDHPQQQHGHQQQQVQAVAAASCIPIIFEDYEEYADFAPGPAVSSTEYKQIQPQHAQQDAQSDAHDQLQQWDAEEEQRQLQQWDAEEEQWQLQQPGSNVTAATPAAAAADADATHGTHSQTPPTALLHTANAEPMQMAKNAAANLQYDQYRSQQSREAAESHPQTNCPLVSDLEQEEEEGSQAMAESLADHEAGMWQLQGSKSGQQPHRQLPVDKQGISQQLHTQLQAAQDQCPLVFDIESDEEDCHKSSMGIQPDHVGLDQRAMVSTAGHFGNSPRNADSAGQLGNSPPGLAPPELLRQSPHDLAVSGQFRQSPHDPAVSGQFRQRPHNSAVSGQFRPGPYDPAVSGQFRQSPYDPAVSGQFRQSPPAWDPEPGVHRSTVHMQPGCEDRSQQHDQDMSHGQSHDQSSHDQLCNNGNHTDTNPDEGYCPIVFGLESEEEEQPEGAEPQTAEEKSLAEHADVNMISDHEVEEWSAPDQDPALPMVTHQPDVKKRSRIRDELFQGLLKRAIEQTGEKSGGLQPLVAQLSEAINEAHMLPQSKQTLGAEAPNTLASLMEACSAMQSTSSSAASTQKYFLALLILAQKTNSSSHNISLAGDPVQVTRQSDAAQPRHITFQRHTAVKSADDPLTAEMLEVVLSGR